MIDLTHINDVHLEGCFAFVAVLVTFAVGWLGNRANNPGAAETLTTKLNKEN